MLYDIIGDVHGCYDEFLTLTHHLGYELTNGWPVHPKGRKLVFVGDITDRGPHSLKMIHLVSDLVNQKLALYVPGNHCDKLYRFFLGRPVHVNHGLETTVCEYKAASPREQENVKQRFMKLYEEAPLYLQLDGGKLVVCHAGIKKKYIGRFDKVVRTFVLYGDITGEKHPDGSPVRRDWAKSYDGEALIVYGHTPVKEPRFVNHTWNIDTGCVFGGALSSLRYPEMEIVSVPSSMPFISEKFRSFD